jgi:hypothetical protein
MLEIVRHAIREMLLQERVFGAQAFVYHGSRTGPKSMIDFFTKGTFNPGLGAGGVYGKGLYSVYDYDGTPTSNGEYGEYVYKLRVNLYGYISFDENVTVQIYGKNLRPSEQAELIGASKYVVEVLQNYDEPKAGEFTSQRAFPASKLIKGLVKGLIFTGGNDGRVALAYDPSTVTPVAWKNVADPDWTPVDREIIRGSLEKNLHGGYVASKFEKPDEDDFFLINRISRLPPHMRVVNRSLNLANKGLERLPDNLTVEGDLIIDVNPIDSLPAGLTVNGNLSLRNTSIAELPPDLNVRNLTIENSPIQALPPGLSVRDLKLIGSAITSLPDDIRIRDALVIKNTNIAELPQHLANTLWSLTLEGVRGISLPRSMNVPGSFIVLNAHNEGDVILPDTLSAGHLTLHGAGITQLPTNLNVDKSIEIHHTSITSLPLNLHVGGYLDVGNNPQLSELPPGLKVNGRLNVHGTGITSIPADAKIRGEVTGLKRQARVEDAF